MDKTTAQPSSDTASRRNTATGQRKRVMLRIWLDVNKPLENDVGWHLVERKKHRQMKRTLVNGANLLLSLEAGRVDVLLTLFPDAPRLLRQHFLGGD